MSGYPGEAAELCLRCVVQVLLDDRLELYNSPTSRLHLG